MKFSCIHYPLTAQVNSLDVNRMPAKRGGADAINPGARDIPKVIHHTGRCQLAGQILRMC
jgi:hypothetical protein